jgi:glycolate oxidase FAD binding subunit
VSRWVDIVGDANVRPGHAADAVDGVVPGWVVEPGNLGEVQACVREVASAGMALVVSGRGAHLDIGARPRRCDVLLRLARLARIVDHQAGDMTVTVEAGCALDVLDRVLAAAGQWLPLDPPRPEATTAGGLVAANLAGPLRAAHGTVRDLVLGLRTVGAEGELVAGGGRVVKNVAGYDLPKLHVGALGTVGAIVEVTWKVRPRPAREEAVVIACPTTARAADTALALRDLAVPPLWLEVAGPGGLADGPGEGAAVAVGFGGTVEEVTHGRALALACAGDLRAVAVADGAALRARLGGFALEPAAAVLRLGTLPGRVGAVMDATLERAGAAGTAVRVLAHAASGIVHVAVAEARAVAALVGELRARLGPEGGTLVVERAGPEIKAALDVWGDPGPGLALMRGLKSAFDPNGVFAPGRFVGGL